MCWQQDLRVESCSCWTKHPSDSTCIVCQQHTCCSKSNLFHTKACGERFNFVLEITLNIRQVLGHCNYKSVYCHIACDKGH